jgi:aryl-alcohol dehydrogenase-like predicted oxidoreductase
METRFMGRTGVRVSRLGFGTMTFGAESDEATSAAIYARCRDAGINLFDCADVYSKGGAEEILGRLVRGHRDELVLATKAYFPMGDGPNERGSSRLHLTRSVERSLARLGTDRIDLFYLHRFDEKTALDESLRAIDDLVRAGKILYLGVSNFAAWQVQKALGIAALHGFVSPVAIQPMYNLLKRQAEVELLPMASSEELAVFPYSPLGAGLLTGKYHADVRPEDGRLGRSEMYADRYGAREAQEGAARFVELARSRGLSPIALAIAWVAAHPSVTAPLLGARSVEQLDEQLISLEVELSDELYGEVAALTPTPPPATDRSDERGGRSMNHR